MSASFWLLAACGEYASRGKGLNCSMSATTGFFRDGGKEKKRRNWRQGNGRRLLGDGDKDGRDGGQGIFIIFYSS